MAARTQGEHVKMVTRQRLWGGSALVGIAFSLTVACQGDDRFSAVKPSDDENTGTGGAAGAPSMSSEGGEAGAGGSTEQVADVVIDDSHVVSGWFNIDYSATLSATGGSGDGFEFELASGDLPQGLALDASGKISGVPLEVGEFTFEVKVTDADGNQGHGEVHMTIQRKRYLAYASDEESSRQFQLYVVDLASSAQTKTPLSPSPTLPNYSLYFRFSPDGSKIAFQQVEEATGYTLYVVDLSGKEPSDAISLGESWGAQEFRWSPSSTSLAWIAPDDVDGKYTVKAADFSEGLTVDPITAGEDLPLPDHLAWVSDSVLTFHLTGEGLGYARRDGEGFGRLARIAEPIRVYGVSPESERGAATTFGDSCESRSTIVDFSDGSYSPLGEGCSVERFFSRDLAWRVDWDRDSNFLSVYPAETLDAEEPVLAMEKVVERTVWAPSFEYFATAIEGTENNSIVLVNPKSARTNEVEFPKSVQGAFPSGFSPDSRWLAFHDNIIGYASPNLYLMQVDGEGQAGRWFQLFPTFPDGYKKAHIAFDPQSRYLLYSYANGEEEQDLFHVALGDEPSLPRKLNHAAGLEVVPLASADSSWAAYVHQAETSEEVYTGQIFLIDLLDSEATAVPLHSSWPEGRLIFHAEFQP